MKHLILMSVVCVVAACASVKPVARTINDAARIACETAFGDDGAELPQGMTPKEACSYHEVLKPFLDSILAAKAAAASNLKTNDEE